MASRSRGYFNRVMGLEEVSLPLLLLEAGNVITGGGIAGGLESAAGHCPRV